MARKGINIDFLDFYKGFDKKENDFYKILSKKYDVYISGDPDYIFYSCFGHDYVNYKGIRIFYTGECMVPNFNECDYAIGFDRLNYSDRYIRMPLYNLLQYGEETRRLFQLPEFTQEDLKKKTGFCNFVYSNCFAQDKRTEIFNKLSEYKHVDSGGRYKNNIGGAVSDKERFQTKYKFSIAFENTSYEGYVTEKITEAFLARTIPIYYGDPNIANEFNEKAFINCHAYDNFDDVVQIVREIDCNDRIYLDMINQPILKTDFSLMPLERFLYNIFDQEYDMAFRRPASSYSREYESMIARHRLFEDVVYARYVKIRNQLNRIGKDTLLTKKRVK